MQAEDTPDPIVLPKPGVLPMVIATPTNPDVSETKKENLNKTVNLPSLTAITGQAAVPSKAVNEVRI